MTVARPHITGCILAGGRGERLGGVDKGLVELAGQPLAAHVLARLRPQVDTVVISANRNAEAYRRLGAPVIGDAVRDYAGPLAGMAAAMEAARTPLIMVTPCDSPFIPLDLVARLNDARAAEVADIALVRTGERRQPVFALLARELLPDLLVYLADGGRKIESWYARHRRAEVDYGAGCADFMNINTADELALAAHRVAPP